MEKWQKDYIDSNLPSLLENTECSILLIARLIEKKALGISDESKLNAKKDKIKKSRSLYQILKTKKNGYDILLEALVTDNQTGAADILKLGNDLQQANNHSSSIEQIEIQVQPLISTPTSQKFKFWSTKNKKFLRFGVCIVFLAICILVGGIVISVQFSGDDDYDNRDDQREKSFTFATILLMGPAGEKGVQELVKYIFGYEMTIQKSSPICEEPELLCKLGIVTKYEIFSNSTNCSGQYYYRLVILDLPVFIFGLSTDKRIEHDAHILAGVWYFMKGCRKESFCDLYFLGYPPYFNKSTSTDNNTKSQFIKREKTFISSIALLNKTSNGNISSYALSFEGTSSARYKFRNSAMILVNISPGDVQKESSFWQFIEDQMKSLDYYYNRARELYFDQFIRGKGFHICQSPQMYYDTDYQVFNVLLNETNQKNK